MTETWHFPVAKSVLNATSLTNSSLEMYSIKWSAFSRPILVRKLGISVSGWPFQASVACWQSMCHLEIRGIISWSSAGETLSAKRDRICLFVCQCAACWDTFTKMPTRPEFRSNRLHLRWLPLFVSQWTCDCNAAQTDSSWLGVIKDNAVTTASLALRI